MIMALAGCFKEDEIVILPPPGDVKTASIGLENDYRYQVYYNLAEERVVATNLKKDWDLGFEASAEGWRVTLNTSKFMLAANTGRTDPGAVADTVGLAWKYDKSDGNPDSTAIGNWVVFPSGEAEKVYTNEVYIINRGYDEVGNLLGVRKIVFESVDEGSYTFSYSMLDGSEANTFTLTKDPSVNFVFFSFDEGGKQMVLEPPSNQWDILFTQYTTLLYTNEGEPYPYLVTGALINRNGVEATRDTVLVFNEITNATVTSLEFSASQDIIGFDWKDVVGDVSTGNVSYAIVPDLNYVIRDRSGFYYKLRFISFYDNSGAKGYPTFEYQRL
jgi:hypothetical protein